MFKQLASLMVMLTTSSVFAVDYSYTCKSLDDNEPYGIKRLKIDLSGEEATFFFEDFRVEKAPYILDATYRPQTPAMQNFFRFNLADFGGNWPDSPIDVVYLEKKLIEGGYMLRIGKKGGFIKMPGHGFSWAKYLCWQASE